MTTSIGNSKVYHFLARTERQMGSDWQKHADKKYGNCDGVVSYNEFVKFIQSEFSNTMGGDVLSNADLNIFWNSVDTDRVDFKNHGKTVKGANNLNAAEFANMDKELEDFIKLEEVCAFAEKQMPSGCFRDTSDEKQWKSIVKLHKIFMYSQILKAFIWKNIYANTNDRS